MKIEKEEMTSTIIFKIAPSFEDEIKEFIEQWNSDNNNMQPITPSILARVAIAEFIHNRKIIKKLGIK